MNASIYAVVDTNVIVSAVMARNPQSPTIGVINHIFDRTIIPVYDQEILNEYREVLSRPKFNFESSVVNSLIDAIRSLGVNMDRTSYPYELPDPKDRVFYEVSWRVNRTWSLATSSTFPSRPEWLPLPR